MYPRIGGRRDRPGSHASSSPSIAKIGDKTQIATAALAGVEGFPVRPQTRHPERSEGVAKSRTSSEAKPHRSAERRLFLERLTSSPDAHTGELAKNSARVPTRFVLRSHSSNAIDCSYCWKSLTGHRRLLTTPMHRTQLGKVRGADPLVEAFGAGSNLA